jgi:hypothetical protein
MTDETTPKGDLSRRGLLKRGAVLGGGLVWAVPTVQAIAPAALAQGTGGSPVAGAVSWVMVWFKAGGQYHLVKYENAPSGYSELCTATKDNVSRNDVNCGKYFDVQQDKVNGLTRNTGCPLGVTAGTNSLGQLVITVGGSLSIVGWVLHDGSCQAVGTTKHPFCRSPENPWKDPSNTSLGVVGPTNLPASGGEFTWTQCK